jgi:hypothetical protein
MQIKRLHMTQVNIPVAACLCVFMDNISFRINMVLKSESFIQYAGWPAIKKGDKECVQLSIPLYF